MPLTLRDASEMSEPVRLLVATSNPVSEAVATSGPLTALGAMRDSDSCPSGHRPQRRRRRCWTASLVDVGALERVVEYVAAQQALVGDLLAGHRAAVEIGGLDLPSTMSELKTVLAA